MKRLKVTKCVEVDLSPQAHHHTSMSAPTARLRQTLLLVRNVANTVEFLGPSGLGLRVLAKSENYAELEASETTVLAVKEALREADLCKGYSPFLCFDVDDVDMLVPNLIMKGATLDGGIKHEPEGKFAMLRSADGVSIGLREILFTPAQLEMMKDADDTLNRQKTSRTAAPSSSST